MELPYRQQRLHEVMFRAPQGDDVEIRVIYGYVYDAQSEANTMAKQAGGVRYMQQSLGPVIKRLNERLVEDKLVIRPGKTKQTYRLDTLSAVR